MGWVADSRALLALVGQVGQRLALVVDDLVRVLDELVDVGHHLQGLLVLVEVSLLSLLVAGLDVLLKEGWIYRVHDLAR